MHLQSNRYRRKYSSNSSKQWNGKLLSKTSTFFSVSFRFLAPKGLVSGYSKSVYGSACTQKLPTYVFFPQTMLDEHPPTPPPSRWLFIALITLPTLAKFQLVWRRFCDVVLFSSCLVEHTLFWAACVLPQYHSGHKDKAFCTFCDHLNVPYLLDRTRIVLEY